MNDTLLITHTEHQKSISSYLNWVFKDKRKYVILRSYYNNLNNTTKLFVVLPVSEREFASDTMDTFKPSHLDNTDFPFAKENMIRFKTIYSGKLYDFYDIPRYLNSFKIKKSELNPNNIRYSNIKTYSLFKDYTVDKATQCNNFALIQSFINPADSVDSIYRLIQRKYVTVIDIEFNGKIEK
jgi:hypothetical protein